MSTDRNAKPQPCIVLRFNHFDPTWRRCWDRDFHDSGRRFVSYRAIEEACIEDAIKTSRDGASCYTVEAAWVLRHYLERHPEHLKTLRKLVQEGRFELLGAGENIVDANMVHGELLARNLALGTLWAEETLGVRPATGCHGDGFGSSAQMPQIFRQCGYSWLPGLSYNVPDAPYWRGLDGSIILFEVPGRLAYRWSNKDTPWTKLPPCPACKGKGCKTCRNRGFQDYRAEFGPPAERLAGEVAVLWVGGEEVLPGFHVAEDVAELNKNKAFAARQGTYQQIRPYLEKELAVVDNPPAEQISSKVENNPTAGGCLVTRIKIKQNHRMAEHALLAAECWDTLLTGGRNADRLRDAWRQMTLSAFHDALPCSHVDPAYDELMDVLAGVQSSAATVSAAVCKKVLKPGRNAFTVFNSQAFPATVPVTLTVPGAWEGAAATADGEKLPVYEVKPEGKSTAVTLLAEGVPGLGAKTIVLSKASARVGSVSEREVSCGRFTVVVGENGITEISAAGIGTIAVAKNFLVGELLLEHDFGDPWATRSFDRTRERMSPWTRLEGVERHNDSVVVTYAGKHPATDNVHTCDDPMVTILTWRQVFRLMDGAPWIGVETSVEWYTHSRRLRLAFPSTTDLNRGVYAIPYGVLERDRYEQPSIHANSAGGDWPAIHWAGVQAPGHTFAIFNRGTPSYRVEDGAVTISVLRSPTLPHCLLEPASYVAYNYSGMADHGTHTFRHAIYAAEGDWRDNDVSRQAALFNSGLIALPGTLGGPVPAWKLDAAHVQLAAVKRAEDGSGVVVRLVELSGRPETVHLHAPEQFAAAQETNLLEDNLRPLDRDGDAFSIELKPWKIVSVRFTKG